MNNGNGRKDAQKAFYKTSDIQALYGLSNKGLFFYEDRGLISPKRLPGSQYRVYTLEETARLNRCRMFREMGFSVEESISMVCHSTPQTLCAALRQRQEELELQAVWQSLVLQEIRSVAALTDSIAKEGIPFLLCQRPAMYRIPLRNTVENSYTPEAAAAYHYCQDHLPVAAASLLVSQPSLENGADPLQVNLGFILNAAALDRWEEELPPLCTLLPSAECLYTIVVGPDHVLDRRARFEPALQWLRQNGRRLSGDVVTRMIATFDAGGGMLRYDQAWLPVK